MRGTSSSERRNHSVSVRRRRSVRAVLAGIERLEQRQMLAIDMNGDGLRDLLWQNSDGGVVTWIRNQSGQNTTASRFVGGDSQWKLVAHGDFNADRVTDLVWRHAGTGASVLWVMRSDGNGPLTSQGLGGDLEWRIEALGDYNGDGHTDLIWRSAVTGINVIWLMDGTRLRSGAAIGGDLNWRLVGDATGCDANADGRDDLLWRHIPTGAHVQWFMNGPSIQGTRAIGGDLDWSVVGVGRKLSGSVPDLLWGHKPTGTVIRWFSGNSQLSEVLGGSPQWRVSSTPDLDNDGVYDIVWRHDSGMFLGWVGTGRTALPLGGDTKWSLYSAGVGSLNDSGISPAVEFGSIASPRRSGVSTVTVSFSEPVRGVQLESFSLVRDGVALGWSDGFYSGPPTLSGSGATYTLGNLARFTEQAGNYILAISPAGISTLGGVPLSAGSVASWTNNAGPPEAPGTPVAVSGDRQVLLTWTPPVSDARVVVYLVYFTTDPTFSTNVRGYLEPAETLHPSQPSKLVTGLLNGVTYYFRVSAANAASPDEGPYSNIVSATPGTVVALPGQPGAPVASAGNGQVALQWSPPAGSTVSSYRVQWSTSSSFSSPVTASATGASYTATNLVNGTTYYFRVAATNSFGTGSYSASVSATPTAGVAVPGQPATPTAAAGNGQVQLQWVAPSGSSVSSYRVQWSTSSTFGSPSVATVSGTSYTVSNLVNGTQYYFRVAATNSAGTGNYSGSVSATPKTSQSDWWAGVWETNQSAINLGARDEGRVILNIAPVSRTDFYTTVSISVSTQQSYSTYPGSLFPFPITYRGAGTWTTEIPNSSLQEGVFDVLLSGRDRVTGKVEEQHYIFGTWRPVGFEDFGDVLSIRISIKPGTDSNFASWRPVTWVKTF